MAHGSLRAEGRQRDTKRGAAPCLAGDPDAADHDLALSRDVVASLDGEIMIDSIAGKGTTVRIALPPTHEIVEAAGATEMAAVSAATTARRRRILIIDDDRPVAAAIALELGVHDVMVTESGREALELLRRDKDFDLILCDLMMPELTGMNVYEALRTLDPSLLERIVLMTGGAFTPQARRFVADVNAHVLEKPFQVGELRSLVEATPHRRPPHEDPGPQHARASAPSRSIT